MPQTGERPWADQVVTMQDPLRADECHVWWAAIGPGQQRLSRLLDQREQERAARIRHDPSRALYVLAHATARLVVSALTGLAPAAVPFTAVCRHCAGPHGRPQVTTELGLLRLSISHSGQRVAVAVTRDVDVGVDVERIELRGAGLPTGVLSPSEQAVLNELPEHEQLPALIRYWTRKEAVLKATGDGLVIAPAALTVSAPSQPPALLAWTDRPFPHTGVELRDLSPGPGYRASLALLAPGMTVREKDATSLIEAVETVPQ
jgi:4'-phosphopantetheinyl transferase